MLCTEYAAPGVIVVTEWSENSVVNMEESNMRRGSGSNKARLVER